MITEHVNLGTVERGNLTKINSIEEINRSKMTGVFYMYEDTG